MSLVAGALQAVFTIVLGYVYNVLGMLTGSFLVAAVSIFNWVTDENFISLSYTNAGLKAGDNGFNSFVNVGWTLTRDFTNIIFVIALVVIGLATALRISDYKVQKTLPMFIAVALLINFTPVILGFVIDASNIVTNFFIGSGFAGGNTLANKIFGQWSNLSALNGGVRFWDPIATNESMAASVGSMVLTSFNLFAGLIYLLFALIFAIRYVALWTLVVLSPLAFACYILPATKGVWAMWWKQFIQWCLVGVIASFFLYLADHLIYMTSRGGGLGISESLKDPTGLPGVSSILNATFPYAIPLVLLFVGLFASLSFAPKGADSVIKAGQKGIQKAGNLYAKGNWKMMKGITENIVKTPSKMKRTYTTSRTMGNSRLRSFGAAVSRPTKTWRQWKPVIPKKPFQAFKTAKTMGMPTRNALGIALKRWKDWEPAGVKTRAISKGLKKAAKDVWGESLGKKTKTRRCPRCGSEVQQGKTRCSVCGYDYIKRRITP